MSILYEYTNYLSTYYAVTTQKNYLENVKLFIDFLKMYKGKVNQLTLYNVTKEDIYNYVAFISDRQKGSIKIRLASLKNFYLFLNRDLGEYLFEDIKLYDTNNKLPYYLSSQEIHKLYNYYNGEKKDIIFLFLNLGIRLSELEEIDFKNINYKENYFTIIQKGGTQRKVYFSNKIKRNFAKI